MSRASAIPEPDLRDRIRKAAPKGALEQINLRLRSRLKKTGIIPRAEDLLADIATSCLRSNAGLAFALRRPMPVFSDWRISPPTRAPVRGSNDGPPVLSSMEGKLRKARRKALELARLVEDLLLEVNYPSILAGFNVRSKETADAIYHLPEACRRYADVTLEFLRLTKPRNYYSMEDLTIAFFVEASSASRGDRTWRITRDHVALVNVALSVGGAKRKPFPSVKAMRDFLDRRLLLCDVATSLVSKTPAKVILRSEFLKRQQRRLPA